MLMPSIFGESLMDDFFNEFTRPAKRMSGYTTRTSNIMRTDVKESESGFELDIELPGYKKEDITAELKDGYLTINAATQSSKDEQDENGKFIRRERYSGSCSRSFYVGEDLEQEDIKARFTDGILQVEIPKKEAKPVVEEKKYIAIEG